MTRTQFEAMLLDLRRQLEIYERADRGCRGCIRYVGGKCLLYDSEVPEEFVAQGCDEWRYDDVPF